MERERGSPRGARLTALGRPRGSGSWTSGRWGLREETVAGKREEGVVKGTGAGRAEVPWAWDPKSSQHSRLLARGGRVEVKVRVAGLW